MNAARRAATALFAIALRLCPPAFRREYGATMRDDFARAFADESTIHGAAGALAYACGAVTDLVATAFREYAAMFARDLSYALRAIRKTPSFSAVVIATLALAIGANAAVFSILHAVVLSPLPYADPERLVALRPWVGSPSSFSLPDYADVTRAAANELASSAAYELVNLTLTGTGEPQKLLGISATPRLFDVLGVRPELGRFTDAHDTAPGAPKTVVLADGLWRTAFGADPHAIGAIARFDGEAYRIVGVAPPDFHQPFRRLGYLPAIFWTVLPENGAGTEYTRGYHEFEAVGRLRPGATLEALQSAANAEARRLAERDPADDLRLSVRVASLTESLVGSARPLLFALFAAVGGVLLVGCANVANLLLSRGATRDRDVSIRIALGASRGRIVTQFLVETFVLALAGGVLGIALAYGAVATFVAFHPPHIPRAEFATVDGAAILYTFGIVAFCTFAAGLAPAIGSSRRDVATALKSAGRGGDAHRGNRARNVLVASEIALTLALVVAAGLVVRSFLALTSQPLGFEPAGVAIVGEIDLPDRRYATDAARAAFMARVLERARAIPGVELAAWVFSPPFARYQWGTTFTILGRHVSPGSEPDAALSPIGADYFAVTRAAVLAGRTFTPQDRRGSQPVAIVNESLARTYFSGRSAIGRQIVPGVSSDDAPPPPRTIVGVVADMRTSFTEPTRPKIYVPEQQVPIGGSDLIVRARSGTNPGPAVASAIADLDPLLPRPGVSALPSLMANDVAVQRLTVVALSALAVVALALSIAGIFAVVSYGVSQRTHEFGVRMALGADARTIVRTVLGGAMRLAFAGIVLGLVVAGAGTRLIADQLYDTEPLDPLTFGTVTVLVVVAALVAAIVPARRATRVDPIVALRYE